jgi:hypothetical protein
MKAPPPENGNGMTFVDWVFAGFLFIVGVSIPIRVQKPVEARRSDGAARVHVLSRTAGLAAVAGVFMDNCERDVAPHWLAGEPVGDAGLRLRHPRVPLAAGADAAGADDQLGPAHRRLRGVCVLAATFRDAKGAWMRTECGGSSA